MILIKITKSCDPDSRIHINPCSTTSETIVFSRIDPLTHY